MKFSVASSLTDDRQWIHFVAQQGAPVALRRLIECGSDIHARDAVSAVPALAVAVQPVRVIGLPKLHRRWNEPLCTTLPSTARTTVLNAAGFFLMLVLSPTSLTACVGFAGSL